MKFEISGFYRSGGLFQARGPGKVLPFYPPLDGPGYALGLVYFH